MHRLERAGVQLGQAPEEVRAVGSRLMMAVNEKVSPVVEIRVTALQGSTSVLPETPEKTDGHNEGSLVLGSPSRWVGGSTPHSRPVTHRGGLDWLAD